MSIAQFYLVPRDFLCFLLGGQPEKHMKMINVVSSFYPVLFFRWSPSEISSAVVLLLCEVISVRSFHV